MSAFDKQMAEAVKRQREHVNAAHEVDRRGWTQAQWVEDARRLMSDMDGSVLDLANGHVTALLRENTALREVAEEAAKQHQHCWCAEKAAVDVEVFGCPMARALTRLDAQEATR